MSKPLLYFPLIAPDFGSSTPLKGIKFAVWPLGVGLMAQMAIPTAIPNPCTDMS